MAKKKPTINPDLFAKTATHPEQAAPTERVYRPHPGRAAPTEAAKPDNVRPVSVSLRDSEYKAFDEIAGKLNPQATRMAVMNEALRDFLRRHKAGKVKLASRVESGRVLVKSD
jgi:predicted transcriptional regulator